MQSWIQGTTPHSDTLTVLTSVAAPLAMGTPTRTLPDVPILALFVEFEELRGTESVLK